MSQRDLQTVELDDDSVEYPTSSTPPRPPMNPRNRRSTAFGVAAALLVVALGIAIFASFSARRSPSVASASSAAETPAATASQSVGTSPMSAPAAGSGLPEGVEVVAYAPTGADEGWGTGAVITNPITGFPDRSMVYHYSAGSWTQVGSALSSVYLGGIDMVSASEGWVLGGNDSGKGLLLHITNGSWQPVSLPAADAQGTPSMMAMRTSDEGWMAMANPKGAQGGANTSLLHDSGGNWSLVSTTLHYITDIAPVANGEAWVVGWNTDGTSSLAHVQGGAASVELTSPANSSFDRLRFFAPNDIWIEGAMHADSNAEIDDVPLLYHYDGAAWKNVDLHVPQGVQHAGMVTGETAWSYLSAQPSGSAAAMTSYGVITSLYTNAGGSWKALALPYRDLQSLTVVSTSADDVWAEGVYMVTTQAPNHNGASSYASVGHSVLLHYAGGVWTEYGR